MAKYQVETQDGTFDIEAENDQQLNDAVAHLNGSAPTAAPKPDLTTRPDGYNLAQKFGRGVGDVVEGVAQLGLHGAKAVGIPGAAAASDRYDTVNNNYENTWQANRAQAGDTGIEWMRGAGSGVAMAPALMAIPEMGMVRTTTGALVKSGRLAPALAESAAQGAVSGAVSPAYGNPEDYASNKASQVGIATGLGGVTGGILNRIGTALRPEVDQSVRLLRNEGVPLSLGQNISPGAAKIEDALSTVNPMITAQQNRSLDGFNIATYNRALAPLARATGTDLTYTGPAGREGVRAVGDVLSDGYDAVKSQVSLPITPPLQRDLTAVVNEASVTAPEIGAKVQRYLDEKVLNRFKSGALNGDAFKEAESALTSQASRYSKSLSGDERTYAQALHDAADVLRDHLAIANPEQAPILQALNRGWAVLTRIEDAVPTGSAEGKFTPFQLARSVEKGDATVRHRQYVRGESMLQDLTDAGMKVLGNKYPDSGTAGRTMLGLGVLGGTAAISPASAVALASSALAYHPAAQRILGSLVNGQRSLPVRALGTGIQAVAPYAGAGAALMSR